MTNNNSVSVYGRLLSYVWQFKMIFALGILGNILYGLVDAGFVYYLQPLIDDAFVDRNPVFISWIPITIIGIFCIRGLANFLAVYCMGYVGRNVVMVLRQQMFNHLLKLPASFYDHHTNGELLSKITFNVEQVAEASSDAITTLLRETFTAIGLIGVMLYTSWRLTLMFFIVIPIMSFVMHWVSKRMRSISTNVQNSMAHVTQVTEEAIDGHKVIKGFGGQPYEKQQFKRATDNNRYQEMKMMLVAAVSMPIIQVVGSVALAGIVYFATLNPEHWLKTSMTPGSFTGLVGAMLALLRPIKQLTKINSSIQRGIAGAASIFDFLDKEIEKDTGKLTLQQADGNIEFKNVSFAYHNPDNHNQYVLKNINFSVKPGQTIAIVGRSGGGKSTLVNLLPRFYDSEGVISIDGINIKNIPLRELRHNIAMVTQNVTLFNDTIANNISYGTHATNADIIKAAEQAFVLDFTNSMPDGLETVIGENGVRLSGGQRQRIAIARAILKKAPILILDEATSSLDNESEVKIQQALDKLMHNCTTLVIAHRLSTIERADKILVVENGEIIQNGTHDELMQTKGLYLTLQTMTRANPTRAKTA